MDTSELTEIIRQAKLVEVEAEGEVQFGEVRLKVEEGMRDLDEHEPWLINCTDERSIDKIIDPDQHSSWDVLRVNVFRVPGALLGLVDAIMRVKPKLKKKDIIEVVKGANVIPANHIDTHAKEGSLTGCGYAGLRALESCQAVFGLKKIADVTQTMAEFEQLDAKRIVLAGDHTGKGLMISLFANKALHPSAEKAKNSFFCLDLGMVWEVMKQIDGELGLNEEEVRKVLVGMVRDNLSAVFVLSNGEINQFHLLKTDVEGGDGFLTTVVVVALGQFKTKAEGLKRMIEERRGKVGN